MGGLNLAALLTNEGKRVLVLEKSGRDQLGGRATSGKIGSAAIDNGIKGLILAGSQDERGPPPAPQRYSQLTSACTPL